MDNIKTFGIGFRVIQIENTIIRYFDDIVNAILRIIVKSIRYFLKIYNDIYYCSISSKIRILSNIMIILGILVFLYKYFLKYRKYNFKNNKNNNFPMQKFFNQNLIKNKNQKLFISNYKDKDNKLLDFIDIYNKKADKLSLPKENLKIPFYTIMKVFMNKKF